MLSELFSIRPRPDNAAATRAQRRKDDRKTQKVERRTGQERPENQRDKPQEDSAGISRYA